MIPETEVEVNKVVTFRSLKTAGEQCQWWSSVVNDHQKHQHLLRLTVQDDYRNKEKESQRNRHNYIETLTLTKRNFPEKKKQLAVFFFW